MEPSVLHSQIALFSERDDCLYFALGLARTTEQLMQLARDQAWDAHKPGLETTDSSNAPQRVLLPDEDKLLDFILGLISFSMRYQQAVQYFDVRLILRTILTQSLEEPANKKQILPGLLR